MSTFVYDLASSIDERWQEVNLLIQKATDEKNANLSFYDALCRATVLLIVAHLEGFVKDVAKAVVYDINNFSSYSKTPLALRRTFCKTFIDPAIGEPKEVEQRTQKLIDVFNSLETKFAVDPFLIEGQYGNNKNPSPSVISKVCSNFGIRNFFSWLKNSRMDIVFSGTRSEVEDLLKDLQAHTLSASQVYPYTFDLQTFGITEPSSTTPAGSRTLWESFLDLLMKNRNDIAHGSISINSLSNTELEDFRNKVLILEYTLIIVLCYKSKTNQ